MEIASRWSLAVSSQQSAVNSQQSAFCPIPMGFLIQTDTQKRKQRGEASIFCFLAGKKKKKKREQRESREQKHQSNNNNMSAYLPLEILSDILLRLPIDSIVRCTSVCKSWNSLIKSPNFISSHLRRSISSADPLLLLKVCNIEAVFFRTQGKTEFYSLHCGTYPFKLHSKLHLPFHSQSLSNAFSVVGSCHGLVCLADVHCTYVDRFYIWNPCIRHFVNFSRPNVASHGPFEVLVGFGHDPKSADYKVVRVGMDCPEVEVYSLAQDRWNVVSAWPPVCEVHRNESCAFVRGALHWAAERMNNDAVCSFIISFNLEEENFREMRLPERLMDLDDDENASFSFVNNLLEASAAVSVYRDSLAVFNRYKKLSRLDVWWMKSYGVEESWTKLFTFDLGGGIRKSPNGLGFLKTGDVVMEANGALILVDSKTYEVKGLDIRGHWAFCDYYVESLLLLNKSNSEKIQV